MVEPTATSTYATRPSPLSGETHWTLHDGRLIQQRGKSRVVHPLSGLSRMTLLPAKVRRPHPCVTLRFGRNRVMIAAAGFDRRRVETHLPTYGAFVRALAAEAAAISKARFVLAGAVDRRSPLTWAIALLGAGAFGMLLTAMSNAARSICLSLASHLIFVALLLGSVLPWLEPTDQAFDPLAIADSRLPR